MLQKASGLLMLLCVLLLGGGLSFGGFFLAQSLEEHNSQGDFQRMAELSRITFEQDLKIDIDVLYDLRGLYMASRHVDRKEFAVFTQSILQRHPSIKALEWIPRVFQTDRQQYEEAARLALDQAFFFTQRGADGRMERADVREEYFPVYYVEPHGGNEVALGFDLGSNDIRRQLLEASRDADVALGTAAVNLIQDSSDQKGLLVTIPVYSGATDTIEQRRQSLRGFVLGAYHIAEVFESALVRNRVNVQGMVVELREVAEGATGQLLHRRGDLGQIAATLPTYRQTLDIVGQQWQLIAWPTVGFVEARRSWLPLSVFFVGLLLTFMLCGYLYNGISREAEIRRLVDQRARELEISEHRYKVILNTAVNAIITIDAQGTVHQFNAGAERMFGYNAREIVGQNIKVLMPEPYHSSHDGYLDMYQKTGQASIIGHGREVVGLRKDGSTFPLDLAVGESGGEDNRMFVGILTDITVRKEAELALIRSKEEAEESNRLKSEFINMMSHELRTPLTVILGYLPLLKQEKSQPPASVIAQIATDMARSGDHLLTLINELLDLSKIEADRMDLAIETLNLPEVIKDVIAALQIKADEKGLELVSESEDTSIQADPIRLKQILINLVGNAIKFTDTGRVTVTAARDGTSVKVSVQDTGCGIAPADLPLIFNKFHQVDSSSTRAAGGTGLGLAISQRLVQLHGGSIEAQSTPGQGSTFLFTIADTRE